MQGPRRGAKVLVTEDNPLHMKIFKLNLAQSLLSVYEAANGEDALAIARAERPDLILADLSLPKMDGFALIRALKADPATADIPIIAISARSANDPAVAAIRPEIVDFVAKPFDPEALTEFVVRTIHQRLSGDPT